MANLNEKALKAADAILDEIIEICTDEERYTQGDEVLRLAEAYAWIRSPAQPHGGATKVTT